jgi:hypothetical protein
MTAETQVEPLRLENAEPEPREPADVALTALRNLQQLRAHFSAIAALSQPTFTFEPQSYTDAGGDGYN